MKQFNLSVLGFAYMLMNNQTLVKLDESNTKVQADKDGNVSLVATVKGKHKGKQYKAGDSLSFPIEDVMGWVEDNQWEDVPKTDEDKANEANKEKIAELRKAEKKAQSEALLAEPADFPAKKEAWMKIKTELDVLTAKSQKAGKAKEAEITYTEDEQKTIAAYMAKKLVREAAKTALDTAIAEEKTAKEALPTTYKTKGTRATGTGGGPKPPKMTDAIRLEIAKAVRGEAYTANGEAKPATGEVISAGKVAKIFGYSGAYTTAANKKALELEAAAAKKK